MEVWAEFEVIMEEELETVCVEVELGLVDDVRVMVEDRELDTTGRGEEATESTRNDRALRRNTRLTAFMMRFVHNEPAQWQRQGRLRPHLI